MAKYFAGTRLALYGRSSLSVISQATVGSPTRYDADFVSSCIQFPAGFSPSSTLDYSESITIPIGIDAVDAPDVYIKFDWLSGSSVVANTTSAANTTWRFVEFMDAAGAVIARMRPVGANASPQAIMFFNYWNGSAWIQAGSTINSPSAAARAEIQLRIVGGASGTLQIWINGGLELDLTAVPFNRTGNIKSVRISNPWNAVSYCSQIAISDFDMRGYKFPSDVLNGPGTFNDGTGAAADTGDLNFNTAKSLPANLDKYDGAHAARTLPGNLAIESVTVGAIMRAASPVANARAIAVIAATSYPAPANMTAPNTGFDWRGQDFPTNPAGGDWTQASYNAAGFGHEART